MYQQIIEAFKKIVEEHNLESEKVKIVARQLTPEEAIGNPEDRDYPIITGVERMMQAEFRGAFGQAFTDMYGNFEGTLSEILTMDLGNNYRRAILISTVNAVMRYLGLIDQTVHCKDEEPKECSRELLEYVKNNYNHPKIAFVGFQPRMIQTLAPHYEMKVTDMDQNNIGTEKFGVIVYGPDKTREHIDWCDLILATGTTAVNGSIINFVGNKPVIFYGVTIAGVAKLLGLQTFCAYGK